jgi:double-strand break repair protein AddB
MIEGAIPRVFALAPGEPFARRFAEGFHARIADPLTAARTLVLVGTRRARRAIEEALADGAPGPGLLPRVELLSELYADPLATDMPPAIARMRRQLRLTRLVERFLEREPLAPAACAPDLAESLAQLIERFYEAGIAPDAMDRLLDGSGLGDGPAAHWERTLRFVDIVRRGWPRICVEAEGGAPDPGARQRAAVEAMIARWAEEPPSDPVIVAGSTGSAGSTAELMAAVARLPQGAVVLPGFDAQIEPAIWCAAGPDHPAGIFRPLLERLSLAPAVVRPWTRTRPSSRHELLQQALRPAPVTDHWHEAAGRLRGLADEATAGLTLIEADSPRHEAEAIAVAIRAALEEPGATIALVSPDAALARRVSAALSRFGIVPDDTLGGPLAQSAPAVLLRLVASVAAGPADPVAIAALLQHPLLRPGMPRGEHLRHARAYERRALRGVVAPAGAGRLPPWPALSGREATDDGAQARRAEGEAWLAAIEAAISPLVGAVARGAPMGEAVVALRRAAEALTDAGDGPELWREAAGERLDQFFADLEAAADAFGDGPVGDVPSLLRGLMRGETVRPAPERPHPRVAIRGPREARVLGADLVILAGLNDGVWPAAADPGPWLSRPMCAELGLPLPERSIGLAAHDFLQGACQPRVILSRARKTDGTPTVASRWLVRLGTLVEGIGAEDCAKAMRARGERYLALARRVAEPEVLLPPAERPRPVPPAKARPRRLSVTQIETLIRDAYAIYARKVLRLEPLDPLGRAAGPLERGNVVHEIMQRFTGRTLPDWPGAEAARGILMAEADAVLAREVPWPDLRRAWRARIARFADWFIATEEGRRADAIPVATEVKGEMELELPGGPFTISARADRIDRRDDGRVLVYDYKTGSRPSPDQIKARFAQQIQLQAAILAAGGFEGLPPAESGGGAYIGLTGSGDGGVERRIELTADELEGHVKEVRDLLTAFDTGAPWVSLGRPEKAFDRGDYDHLARRQEWWGSDE